MTVRKLSNTLQQVFSDAVARSVFPLVSVAFFVLGILLLVVTIPGNTIRFQLSILKPSEYTLLLILSLLIGLHTAVQIRVTRARWSLPGPRTVGHTAVTGTAGLFAVAIGTAACASCIAPLFGFVGLGMGSALFVLEYRPLFLTGAITVVLASLYVNLRRRESTCASCAPRGTGV